VFQLTKYRGEIQAPCMLLICMYICKQLYLKNGKRQTANGKRQTANGKDLQVS
jgi:hypothetical protein